MAFLVALVVAVAAQLGLTPPGGPAPRPAAEVEADYARAKRLMDGYHGDTAVLIEADGLLHRVLRADPKHARAHAQSARVVYRLGYRSGHDYDPAHLARARALAEKAIALDPNLPDAYRIAGWIALSDRRNEDARRLAAQADRLEPDGALAPLLLAEIDVREGKLEAAEERYRGVLARAPDDDTRASVYAGLIDVHCGRKEYDACEADHREVIRLDPRSAWAKGNYAQLLVGLEKWDPAIEYATAAVAQMNYPIGRRTLSRAHLGKGWDLLRTARLDEAQGHFERAVAADPDHAEAHFGLGYLYVQRSRLATGKPEDRIYVARAEAAFTRAAELDPSNPRYRNYVTMAGRARQSLEHP